MTPFISDTLYKRLPSLPQQHALVFGTSVNLPTTFYVSHSSTMPKSDDAKIRDLWFHRDGRSAQVKLSNRRSEPQQVFNLNIPVDATYYA